MRIVVTLSAYTTTRQLGHVQAAVNQSELCLFVCQCVRAFNVACAVTCGLMFNTISRQEEVSAEGARVVPSTTTAATQAAAAVLLPK